MNSLLEVLSKDNTPEELARGFEEYHTFLVSAKERFPTQISLAGQNFVVHEILFRYRGRWIIQAQDIRAIWSPNS